MSTNRLVRLDAIVLGHVQGVGFRYHTAQQAQRLGLVGWVANQPDGSVRVVAEGSESVVQAFVNYLQIGPPQATVDRVIESRGRATGGFSSFRIQNAW